MNNSTHSSPSPRKTRKGLILLLILIALLLLFLLQWRLAVYRDSQTLPHATSHADSLFRMDSLHQQDSLRRIDSLHQQDSLRRLDSLRIQDSLRISDSLRLARGQVSGEFLLRERALRDSLQRLQDSIRHIQDSLRHITELRRQDSLTRSDSLRRVDSLSRVRDSIERHRQAEYAARRAADKTPPAGMVLPPQGRYYEVISVRAQCSEPQCRTWVSWGDTLQPQDGSTGLSVSQSGRLFWRLEDSVGNRTAWSHAEYDIAVDHRCGPHAFPVPVGGKQICVDAYEYPNRPEELPKDMVSLDMANQLCTQAGKRLCTLNEWQTACQGKEKSRYPYGQRYDQTRCATAQNKAARSGRQEGCRSWWGMQDMAGNLWEWTSTPHPQRTSFYYVAGGSWNTQEESSCSTTKFSFYPQNQYPFVGFRCCADLP